MGSLKLANNIDGVDYIEYRDLFFFNRYKYRAKIKFEGLIFTYYAENINQYVSKLKSNSIFYYRLNKNRVLGNLETIKNFISYKNSIKNNKEFIIRIQDDTASIFSDNLEKLCQLKKCGNLEVSITEAITSNNLDTKYFERDPKHKYRVYLRSTLVETKIMSDLEMTLKQNDRLYPCRAFVNWLEKSKPFPYRWCSSSYFIDYDDESLISYLSLMHDSIIGRKYKLERRCQNN